MDYRHLTSTFCRGGGDEFIPGLAFGKLPLGIKTDALVRVGKVFHEIGRGCFGRADFQHIRDFLTDFGSGDGGIVEFPNRTLFVERVAAGPIGGVESAIWTEIDADVHRTR